jgi:hypothetical protein
MIEETEEKDDAGGEAQQPSVDIKMLDDLIVRYYKRLRSIGNSDIKLGDFLKMVELRRKLNPTDSDQQEIWAMIQKIREQGEDPDPDFANLTPPTELAHE